MDKSYYRAIVGNAKRASFADIFPPLFYCKSCSYCINSRCDIFKRHVVPDYNRCLNHSDYIPVSANFPQYFFEREYKYA